ncbi:nucleotidyltransferase domain-containing protein [Candidatus Amesbacteria bacterium]|nr:nucleotidyltransferase domain-containing protein [Candidatus Amesbacteria bacterium]
MKQDLIIKKAQQFVRLVNHRGIPVQKAYLFGSYATNQADESSDIDVLIVSDLLGNDLIDEMVMLDKIGDEIDGRIEPHPMSSTDFAEKYNLLAHEIKTYGIPLISQ